MWAYENTFYQIYPIGMLGAPRENTGDTSHRILDLKSYADYLEALKVGAVLFNPLFLSERHGYDTINFYEVDNRLGTNADFKDVVDTFHQKNIRVVLDAVYNHTGRAYAPFQDVISRKEASPYRDWFYIDFNGNSCYNDGFWYEGWEGHFELVKLNLQNPAVQEELLNATRFWIDTFDIDGLRLDVAYSLDRNFMHRLREETSKKKKDFCLIGEVLFGNYAEIVNDHLLHSCTNYECYKGLYSSLNDLNLFEIAHSLHRQFGPDPWCIYKGLHLMTFADNHDVTRLSSILRDTRQIRAAYGLLFGMPGIPCIYYGSEWGLEGQKNDGDDALRPCVKAPAPNALTAFIAKLIRVRKSEKALSFGAYENIEIHNKELLFKRSWNEEEIFVATNISDEDFTMMSNHLHGTFRDLLTDETLSLSGTLSMPPFSVQYLKRL